MASGYKDGPPPSHLYVIKSSYDIRYYTTPETYAQALADGYQGELAVYRRCETPPSADVDAILADNPMPTLDTGSSLNPQQMMYSGISRPTPAQQAAYKQYEKDIKARRKRVKAALLKILERC